ncbi:MAG: response regulator [Pseudomonadales bacterium]|jgi:FixJ family two-component response regulator|nr:response regulator [Pseudomonadales bacterium]
MKPAVLEQTVYVIDDDEAVCDSLGMFLSAAGFAVRTYADPLHFLAEPHQRFTGCLLLDLRLPALSGLHLQQALSAVGSTLPIIFITGHGDISSAVQAMKAGAFEFLEKPFSHTSLLEHIRRAFTLDSQRRQTLNLQHQVREWRATLTPRENEVLERIIAGKASKVAALELGLSQRTVEIYRANIMRKMHSKSVAQLVRMLSDTSIDPEGAP